MGLDLIPEGRCKEGHETEWRRLVERAFKDNELTETETARFQEISVAAYEAVGAPRVGYDKAADDWILGVRKAASPEEAAATLKEFHGYHALRLVTCDGVPEYTHGGHYAGVDETSFRGSFLDLCGDVLAKDIVAQAWDHKLPEAAVDYGRMLLDAARTAAVQGPAVKPPPPKPGFLSRLGLGKRKAEATATFEEQLKIAEAAGRWFVFWGERGHPVRAWF